VGTAQVARCFEIFASEDKKKFVWNTSQDFFRKCFWNKKCVRCVCVCVAKYLVYQVFEGLESNLDFRGDPLLGAFVQKKCPSKRRFFGQPDIFFGRGHSNRTPKNVLSTFCYFLHRVDFWSFPIGKQNGSNFYVPNGEIHQHRTWGKCKRNAQRKMNTRVYLSTWCW